MPVNAATIWLNQVFDAGIGQGVSDFHFVYVPDEGSDTSGTLTLRVRHNRDLREYASLAGPDAKQVLNRLKSIAKVDSGRATRPDDGRYVHRYGSGAVGPVQAADGSVVYGYKLNPDGSVRAMSDEEYAAETASMRHLDLRFVVVPLVRGEKVVLRAWDLDGRRSLDQIRMSEHNRERIMGLLGMSNGLVLLAGPVNSGKTSTMYALLEALGGPNKAVYTVEDPVEQLLPGVDQIEVNVDAQLDFKDALRALRRSDVQVLMIGEIRDAATSDAAVQIGVAGAKVLASIHANDSIAAIEAMLALNKDLNPTQVMQSLRGVISQRLVKRVCQTCLGDGCSDCNGEGAKGVIPIHEVLTVSDQLVAGVVRDRPRYHLKQIAANDGMLSLHEDAQLLVDAGLTIPRFVAEVLGGPESLPEFGEAFDPTDVEPVGMLSGAGHAPPPVVPDEPVSPAPAGGWMPDADDELIGATA